MGAFTDCFDRLERAGKISPPDRKAYESLLDAGHEATGEDPVTLARQYLELVNAERDSILAQAQAPELPASQPKTSVDAHAHEAATSPQNPRPNPTDAQKKAGNYAKGHTTVGGLEVSIENPEGSYRRGKTKAGKEWETPMLAHYGYFKQTKGKDKDHVDVFIAPGTSRDWSGPAFVIDQEDPGTGHFDEHKVIVGVHTPEEAWALYHSNYQAGWAGGRSITRMPWERFKEWVKSDQARAQAHGRGEASHMASDLGFGGNLAAAPVGHDFGTWAATPLKAMGIPEEKLNEGTVAVAKWLGRVAKKGADAIRLTDLAAKIAHSPTGRLVGQAAAVAQKELLPKTLLPREAAAWLMEARAAIAWSGHSGEELSGVLRRGGESKFQDFFVPELGTDPAVQDQMARYFRGEIPIEKLPEGVRDFALRISKLWDDRGKAMVDAGIMRMETYLDRRKEGNNYFPHMYAREEAEQSGLRWLGHKLKMGLERVKPQLSTAWYVYEVHPGTTLPVLDKFGVPKLLEHKKNTWRFNSEAHRNQWFDSFVRQEVVDKVRRTGLFDFDLHALESLELQSPETRALARAIETDIRGKYGMGSPSSTAELERAGLITNLAYVVPKSLAQMDHDIALAHLFSKIADEPRFTSSVPAAGHTLIPKDPRFGKLSGQYVESHIAQEIIELQEAPDLAWQIYDAALGKWKTWKTVYNPGTHGRNILGNFFFADLAGVGIQNPANWPHYWDAVKALRGELAEFPLADLYQSGLLGGDYATSELHMALSDVRVPSDHNTNPLSTLMSVPGKAIRKGGSLAKKLYLLEDEVFKVASFIKARRAGMGPEAAVAHTRTWFPYYDQIGKSSTIRTVKRLSSPFLSFMQEALRIGGRGVLERPITFAKWMAIPSLLSLISRAALGMDDDDWEAVKRNMRGQVGDWPVFSALLPWYDDEGKPAQWDLSNVIPYADMLGKRFERPDDLPLWTGLIQKYFLSGPLTQLAIAWGLGQNPFTGQKFNQPDMTAGEVALAQADYSGGLLAPPLTPGIGTADILQTLSTPRREGRMLDTRNRGQEVVRKVLGVDIRSALPNLFASADAFRRAQGLPESPDFKESTLRSRVRREVYDALVNDDVDKLAESLTELRERTGDTIRTQQDINRLFFLRDPAAVIHKKEDRAAWMRSLSPLEREALDKARAVFEAAKHKAPLLIRQAEDLRPERRRPRETKSPLTSAADVLPFPTRQTNTVPMAAGKVPRSAVLPA